MTNKQRAMMVAEKAHANQTYDIYPYMYHIKQVVEIAEALGYDESIIIAATLHDVLEDTSLSYNDLKKTFGREVAEIVYAVTDELGRNRSERKAKTYPKIRANWKAAVVKICDRIANMEHSVWYNKELYAMYKNELPDFFKNINNADHPKEEMERVYKRISEIEIY